eukprot:11605740-Ditylum_brightwellii.AAC.1
MDRAITSGINPDLVLKGRTQYEQQLETAKAKAKDPSQFGKTKKAADISTKSKQKPMKIRAVVATFSSSLSAPTICQGIMA